MSRSLVGLVAGAALLAGAATTDATAEPLTLTGDQLDQVTASGFAFVDGTVRVDIRERIHKDVKITKFKSIFQDVFVIGFFAEATGAANCDGFFGCQAMTAAVTDVSDFGFATSVSLSEAATNPPF